MDAAQPVRIPVGEAFAIVDARDESRVAHLRWHLDGGYALSRQRVGPRSENRTVGIRMHRLITGADRGAVVDHVNGDKLDNRRANLRVCTHASNMQNRQYGYGTSRYRGVHLRANGRWLAQVGYQGRKHHVGVFDTEEEAAQAAAEWRRINIGSHAE